MPRGACWDEELPASSELAAGGARAAGVRARAGKLTLHTHVPVSRGMSHAQAHMIYDSYKALAHRMRCRMLSRRRAKRRIIIDPRCALRTLPPPSQWRLRGSL